MRVGITGICGFFGSHLALQIRRSVKDVEIVGIDNFYRAGSEINRARLSEAGITVFHGDVRCVGDLGQLGERLDWIIDCAAIPTVTAGTAGALTSSLSLIEHNLYGTVNLLETCRKTGAGFILMSTSRVYGVDALNRIPLKPGPNRFELDCTKPFEAGLSERGISENFSQQSPLSLYGATKYASEILALEYAEAQSVPVWINRCSVIAGPGQFGKIDQGILSFWIYSYLTGKALKFIGFGGEGFQVRDFVAPEDVGDLVLQQIKQTGSSKPKVVNLGGGLENSLSLRQISDWCDERFSKKKIGGEPGNRKYDVPYFVTDYSICNAHWDWKPRQSIWKILESVADWAEKNESLVRFLVDAR